MMFNHGGTSLDLDLTQGREHAEQTHKGERSNISDSI